MWEQLPSAMYEMAKARELELIKESETRRQLQEALASQPRLGDRLARYCGELLISLGQKLRDRYAPTAGMPSPQPRVTNPRQTDPQLVESVENHQMHPVGPRPGMHYHLRSKAPRKSGRPLSGITPATETVIPGSNGRPQP